MGEGLERFGGELLGQKRTAGAEHRGVLPKGERLRRLNRALQVLGHLVCHQRQAKRPTHVILLRYSLFPWERVGERA